MTRLSLLSLVLSVTAFAAPPKGEVKPAAAKPVADAKVSAADLEGKWLFDLDATIAYIGATMHLPESALGEMRTALKQNVGTTYTFKGDSAAVHSPQAGDSKGTFTVVEKDLVIKDGAREFRMQVSKPSATELVLSMMGVGSVYKKQ